MVRPIHRLGWQLISMRRLDCRLQPDSLPTLTIFHKYFENGRGYAAFARLN